MFTEMLTRREFLAATSGLAAIAMLPGCAKREARRTFTGGIAGASAAVGHRLRGGKFPPPSETIDVDAVILGGGISGLAAGREFQRQGVRNFLLLEMENAVGGNARSGANAVSAYPWGAHYLPLPSEESTEVIQLLEELKLITGYTADGLPLYDEYALCADPMERLFVNGTWQEGLIPRLDVAPAERAEIDAFLAEMDALRKRRGTDGRRAFALPVDRSSRDPAILALDQITMATYLKDRGWTCEPLHWYVDYCCRDDYGAGVETVSAWAGIHYFASRNARAGNAASSAVLTWPEGNGWLAHALGAPLQAATRSQALVWHVTSENDDYVHVDYLDLSARPERSVRLRARGVVCALPRFVANRLIQPLRTAPSTTLTYSPWLVANLTLISAPNGIGEPLAWDNVLRRGRSLGYVVATHQSLDSHPGKTVLTYYQPLDETDPALSRQTALERSYDSWCEQIFRELAPAHPDLRQLVTHLDVWLWGHAMARPVPGFIWGEERKRMQADHGRIVFAHSDMSGISLFEEAFTRGTLAARVVADKLHSPSSS